MSEGRDKIVSMWVTEETAKLIESVDDPLTKEKYLADAARQVNSLMQEEVDMLDDEVIKYKGMLADFKQKFRQAKKEQLKEMYDIWEDYDKEIYNIQQKISSISKVIEPLVKQAKELDSLLSGLRTHDLDHLLETLETFNKAYYGKNKEIIDFLLENYKTN